MPPPSGVNEYEPVRDIFSEVANFFASSHKSMALVHIDSLNRVSGGTFYDFHVSVDIPKARVTQCILSDFVMPQTAPNIIAPNNVFYYVEAGVNKSVTFPEGQYDLCSFTKMYQTLMDANTSLTFTGDNCYTIELIDYAANLGFKAPQDTLSSTFAIRWSLMPKLAYLLGFNPIDSVSGTATLWSNFSYNFSPDNFIHLRLSPGFPSCTGATNSEAAHVPSTFPISLYSNGGVVSKFDQRLCITVGDGLFQDRMLRVQLFRGDGTPLKISSDWGFTLILS